MKSERSRTKIDKGIYRDQWGIAATVKVGTLQREKRFLPDTHIRTIKNWQEDTRVALRKIAPTATRGTFAADAARYLTAVAAMPTYKEREKRIALWTAEFGGRARSTPSRRPMWMRSSRAGSMPSCHHLPCAIDGRHSCTSGTAWTPRSAEPCEAGTQASAARCGGSGAILRPD